MAGGLGSLSSINPFSTDMLFLLGNKQICFRSESQPTDGLCKNTPFVKINYSFTMVFCFCAFVKSVPPFSRMGLNCKEQFHLGVRPHCTDLPTQMLRSKVSRCMLPLPITIVVKSSAWKYWDDLPESSGTEQSKIPTGTLPLAPGSVSIKLNDITCLIFLTTTRHNWGWQCISLKNLKYFIFLYNIIHQLNAKHLVVSFKIQIRLNSEPTAISVTTHLTMYTRVTHTPNIYSFIRRCIFIDMPLYTHPLM